MRAPRPTAAAADTAPRRRFVLCGTTLVVLILLRATITWAGAQAERTHQPKDPGPALVLVPGVTGSKLYDHASKELLWGSSSRVFFPKDRGHATVLAIPPSQEVRDQADATEVLLELGMLGWSKPIYRPVVEALVAAGYRLGELDQPTPAHDLYLFAYDWRQTNSQSVERLHEALERIAAVRESEEVHLLCQSNAGRICRFLLKYRGLSLDSARALGGATPTQPPYSVEKLVLVGTSNGGALRQLQELHRGRRYVPGIGRYIGPEALFAIRPLFDDLPQIDHDLFFDRNGAPLEVDVFDPRAWLAHGWSIFAPQVQRHVRSHPQLFGTVDQQLEYLAQRLEEARTLHQLLSADVAWFPPQTEIYLLENISQPTPVRALLERSKGGWRTVFPDDPEVQRNAALLGRATAPGDGHATLSSQRALSPQELRALRGAARVTGGHFGSIVEPATHREILHFLEQPVLEQPVLDHAIPADPAKP